MFTRVCKGEVKPTPTNSYSLFPHLFPQSTTFPHHITYCYIINIVLFSMVLVYLLTL